MTVLTLTMHESHNQLVSNRKGDYQHFQDRCNAHRTDLGAVQQEMRRVTQRSNNFHEILRLQQRNFSEMETRLCRCQPDIEQTQLDYDEASPVASGSYVTPPQTSSSQGAEQAVCRSPEPLPVRDPSIAAVSNADNIPPASTVP